MMTTLIIGLFILSSPGDADWILRETEIYRGISRQCIAVNAAGESFLLNPKERQVLKVNAQGQPAGTFGRQGQGPGEMMFPMRLFILGETLYVHDMAQKKVLFFDFDGNYQGQQLFGERFQYLAKTNGGWVGLIKHYFGEKAGRIQLLWMDHSLTERRSLVDYFSEEDAKIRVKNAKKSSNGSRPSFAMPFDPTQANIMFKVIDHGAKIIAIDPSPTQQMAIFSGATGELLTQIAGSGEAIPFNETWGEQQFEAYVARQKKTAKHPSFKQEAFYAKPAFFPYARRLWAFENGYFYVLPWTKDADYFTEVQGFDLQGQPVTHDFTTESLRKLVHLTPEHAWISFYDEAREEIGLAKVTVQNLASFVKTHFPATPDSKSPSP